MKVIKPTTITDASLISSSVSEGDYSAWNAATNYAVGNRVIRVSMHKVYECLIAGVNSTAPEISATEATPKWLEISPTNRWAMFDTTISTVTSATGSISVTIAPGIVNSIALMGLTGAQASVTVSDGSSTVYSATKQLDGSVVTDWYEYFFEPFTQLTEWVLTDLPPYGSARITVVITGSGTVECGILSTGTKYEIGKTKYGARFGITDYSIKSTDEFGSTVFVKRRSAKRIEIPLLIENALLPSFWARLQDVTATPCAWIGSDTGEYSILTVFGFFKDFDVDISYPTISECTLQIEGLT